MSDPNNPQPLTAVVHRRVRAGKQPEFEQEMQRFIAFALSFPGHLSISVLRPDDGASSRDYTVVDQFADAAARRAFLADPAYQLWMARLGVLTEGDVAIEEQQGLAAWFTPPAGKRVVRPSTLKMAAVTFVGVYPLTSLLPPFFMARLPGWHPLLVNVVVTGLIVAALSWAIMPVLTRLLSRWLFTEVSTSSPNRHDTHR